jgi:hypothetical protein
MLFVTLATEDGATLARPTAKDLAAVVARLGAPGDRFLIAEYIGGDPQYYVQVWHESGGEAAYELEWREGSADRHYAVTVRSADEVAARMTAWARRQDDWNAGLVPHKLDLALPEEALTLDDGDRTALEARVREVLNGGYASRAERPNSLSTTSCQAMTTPYRAVRHGRWWTGCGANGSPSRRGGRARPTPNA